MDKIRLFLSCIALFFSLAGLCPAQEEDPVDSAAEVVVEDADAATDETADAPEKKSLRQKGKNKKKRKAGKDRKAEAPATGGIEGTGAIVCCCILGGMWLITLPAACVAVYRVDLFSLLASVGYLSCMSLAAMFWFGIYFEESTALALFWFFIPGLLYLPWMINRVGLTLPGFEATMHNIGRPSAGSLGGLTSFLLPLVLLLVLLLAGSLLMVFYCWGWGVCRSFRPEEL